MREARPRKRVRGKLVNAGSTVQVFTRLTGPDAELLDQLAKSHNVTRALYVRMILERSLESHRRKHNPGG